MAGNKEVELQELKKRAEKLSKRAIFAIPRIKENPLSVILLKRFTVNEKIQTDSLVKALYEFVNGGDRLRILFCVYDTDGDGQISNGELFGVLRTLNRGILEDWKIQNIVDKTFARIGEYKLAIDYEEFKKLVEKTGTASNGALQFL